MKCIVKKSEWLDDWYVIERAEHDGRQWFDPCEGGMIFRTSSRLTGADIEGTAAEMLAIATAIETGESFCAKRCQSARMDTGYAMMSPRNDERATIITFEEATELAADIRAKVMP